jgi:hypothetical protein
MSDIRTKLFPAPVAPMTLDPEISLQNLKKRKKVTHRIKMSCFSDRFILEGISPDKLEQRSEVHAPIQVLEHCDLKARLGCLQTNASSEGI